MNICFVGNSVSAQKESYRYVLQRLISERLEDNVTFINCCLGGMGSLGISFFINRFVAQKTVDLCFIETFVADLKNATPRQYLKAALQGIVQHPCLRNAKIIPVHLYRSDIDDGEYSSLLDIYNQAYEPHHIESIDVFRFARSLIQAQQLDPVALVYDQVHTTREGAEIYAQYIFSQISNHLTDVQTPPRSMTPEDAIVPLEVVNFFKRVISGEYERGLFRYILPYAKIHAGAHLEVITENGGCIGLIIIADTQTGVIDITSDGFHHQAQLYDEWCLYERLQVVIFPQPVGHNKIMRIAASFDEFSIYGANGALNHVVHRGQNIKVVGLMEFDMAQFPRE